MKKKNKRLSQFWGNYKKPVQVGLLVTVISMIFGVKPIQSQIDLNDSSKIQQVSDSDKLQKDSNQWNNWRNSPGDWRDWSNWRNG